MVFVLCFLRPLKHTLLRINLSRLRIDEYAMVSSELQTTIGVQRMPNHANNKEYHAWAHCLQTSNASLVVHNTYP